MIMLNKRWFCIFEMLYCDIFNFMDFNVFSNWIWMWGCCWYVILIIIWCGKFICIFIFLMLVVFFILFEWIGYEIMLLFVMLVCSNVCELVGVNNFFLFFFCMIVVGLRNEILVSLDCIWECFWCKFLIWWCRFFIYWIEFLIMVVLLCYRKYLNKYLCLVIWYRI